MKGLVIDPSIPRLSVLNGDRVVATTEGTLINLIPTLHTFDDLEVEFADPPKGSIRAWGGFQQCVVLSTTDEYTQRQTIQHFYCRNSQEVETAQNVVAAPDGADFFVGHLRLTRTVAPSHQWWGVPLNTLLPTDVWIPWNGSGWVEGTRGIARLLHLVIEGGHLKLIGQQSVGPKVGGAGTQFGLTPSALFGKRVGTGGGTSGGLFHEVSSSGVMVWTSNSSPYRQQKQRQFSRSEPYFFVDSYDDWHPTLGTFPAAADPTDYRSVYSVDIRGRFGRRS